MTAFKTSKGLEWERTETGYIDLVSKLEWKFYFKTNINQYDAEKWANDQGFRLPTIEEFKDAEARGVRELPDMPWKEYWFWSSTPYPDGSGYAYGFYGLNGSTSDSFYHNDSYYYIAARAVSELSNMKVDSKLDPIVGSVSDDRIQKAIELLNKALILLGDK